MSNEPTAAAAAADEPGAGRALDASPTSTRGCSWVKAMAEAVRDDRQPVAAGQPVPRSSSATCPKQIEQALDRYRDARDAPGRAHVQGDLRVAAGWRRPSASSAETPGRRGPRSPTWELEELKRLKRKEVEASIEQGTLLDAWARLLLYVRPRGERRRRAPVQPGPPHDRGDEAGAPRRRSAALKEAIKRQAYALALDEERAHRRAAQAGARHGASGGGASTPRAAVMSARGELTPEQDERFRRVASVLGLDGAAGRVHEHRTLRDGARRATPAGSSPTKSTSASSTRPRRWRRSRPRSPTPATRPRWPARSTRRSSG